MDDAGYFQVLTTTESKDDATALARAVLTERAAACVQVVGPVESHFWWRGELVTAEEWLCVMKTTAARLDPLLQLVREKHGYDVPEVTATPITRGSPSYLDWISEEVLGD